VLRSMNVCKRASAPAGVNYATWFLRVKSKQQLVDHLGRRGGAAGPQAACALCGAIGRSARSERRQFPTGACEGRIVVELSDTSTVWISAKDKRIVDFSRERSDVLRKRYDWLTSQPVQTFSVFPGDNVRMVIEPRGSGSTTLPDDTQFVLEVKRSSRSQQLVQGTRSGYSGEKLSLNSRTRSKKRAERQADFTT